MRPYVLDEWWIPAGKEDGAFFSQVDAIPFWTFLPGGEEAEGVGGGVVVEMGNGEYNSIVLA